MRIFNLYELLVRALAACRIGMHQSFEVLAFPIFPAWLDSPPSKFPDIFLYANLALVRVASIIGMNFQSEKKWL